MQAAPPRSPPRLTPPSPRPAADDAVRSAAPQSTAASRRPWVPRRTAGQQAHRREVPAATAAQRGPQQPGLPLRQRRLGGACEEVQCAYQMHRQLQQIRHAVYWLNGARQSYETPCPHMHFWR